MPEMLPLQLRGNMRPRPKSVFIPFELKTAFWEKVYDLPRFVNPKEVIGYLQKNPNLSSRRLDWIEHFEKEAIDEYVNYVGERPPGRVH